MTHDEMIAVIKAQKEGKKIEQRCRISYSEWNLWYSSEDDCLFNFEKYEYRVKIETL